MAKVTAAGIETTSFEDYRQALGQQLREKLDSNLSLDPETPQGQLIDVFALVLAEADEALVVLANQLSPSNAVGLQLDDLFRFLAVSRKAATYSTVTATLSGAPGTVVPKGTRFRTATYAEFESTEEITLDSDGEGTAACRSLVTGPTEVPIGALSVIVTLVAGLAGVTNAAAGVPGADQETDAKYTRRYREVLFRNARSQLNAVYSKVRSIEGVIDAKLIENATSAPVTARGITTAAHSISVIVEGGIAEDIAEAIAESKGMGVGTSGDVSQVVTIDDHDITINLRRARAKSLACSVVTETLAGFANDGVTRIRQALVDHIASLSIGAHTVAGSLYAAASSVPNHRIISIALTPLSGDDDVLTEAGLDADEKLALAFEKVVVSAL